MSGEELPEQAGGSLPPEALEGVRVRLRAELGRASTSLSRAVGLEPGAIVDLDRTADEPIDLYVNGMPFGTGRLLVLDGEWAVRVETVHGLDEDRPTDRRPAAD